MANNIADLIYSQMAQAGKPRTTTQRTTGTVKATENAPLDLGSLGLLLYLMLSGNKSNNALGAASSPTSLQSFIRGPMSSTGTLPTAYGSAAQQNPIALLLSLLGGNRTFGG